jgi:hypothetical protein
LFSFEAVSTVADRFAVNEKKIISFVTILQKRFTNGNAAALPTNNGAAA